MGSPGQVNAQVGSILLNGVQNINFSSITLDGHAFTLTLALGAAEQWSCCGLGGLSSVTLAPGDYAINLIGTLTGADAGSTRAPSTSSRCAALCPNRLPGR